MAVCLFANLYVLVFIWLNRRGVTVYSIARVVALPFENAPNFFIFTSSKVPIVF